MKHCLHGKTRLTSFLAGSFTLCDQGQTDTNRRTFSLASEAAFTTLTAKTLHGCKSPSGAGKVAGCERSHPRFSPRLSPVFVSPGGWRSECAVSAKKKKKTAVVTCVFSPSRKADATLCRRKVPRSRPFLASSFGHSSHSFRNRRYLVADIFGNSHGGRTRRGKSELYRSPYRCRSQTLPPLSSGLAPLVTPRHVSNMSGSNGKTGASSGVMEWIGSACRFATDRNDFRR